MEKRTIEDRDREKRERDKDDNLKTSRGGGGTSPLASACCSASSRHCGTPPKTWMSSRLDSAVKHWCEYSPAEPTAL